MYIHRGGLMYTRIQKWGNSFGIRIPIQFAEQLKLHANTPVTLEIEGDRIIIQPPKYDLKQMLDQITPENLHGEHLEDLPQGNEEW